MRKHVIFILSVFSLFSCEYSDEVPPAVNIAQPVDQDVVSGRVHILIAATDNEAIHDVIVTVDDDILMFANSGTYMSAEWNTDAYDDGWMHILSAVATDRSGNTNESPPARVMVNNIPEESSHISLIRKNNDEFRISWPPAESSNNYDALFINPHDSFDTLKIISGIPDTAYTFNPENISDAILEIHVHNGRASEEPLYRRYCTFETCFVFTDYRDDKLLSAYIRSCHSPFIRRLTANRFIRELTYSSKSDKIFILHNDGIDKMDGDGSNRQKLINGFYYELDHNRSTGDLLVLSAKNAHIIDSEGRETEIPFKGIVYNARWTKDGESILITALPNKRVHLRCYRISRNDLSDIQRLSPDTDEKDFYRPVKMNDTWIMNDGSKLYWRFFDSEILEEIQIFKGDILQIEESHDGDWFMLVLQKTGLIATDIYYELFHIRWPSMETHKLFTARNAPSVFISPDGKYILYNRDGVICLSSPDGGDERIVEPSGMEHFW